MKTCPNCGYVDKSLTAAESQVMQLLIDGYTSKEIAALRFNSPNTVRNHIQSILNKMEVHTRLQAVLKFIELERVNNEKAIPRTRPTLGSNVRYHRM